MALLGRARRMASFPMHIWQTNAPPYLPGRKPRPNTNCHPKYRLMVTASGKANVWLLYGAVHILRPWDFRISPVTVPLTQPINTIATFWATPSLEAMPSGRAQETATTILMRGHRRGNPDINSLNYCNHFPSSAIFNSSRSRARMVEWRSY